MKRYSGHSILLLFGCLMLPLFVGYMGSIVTSGSVSGWYMTLTKPWFTPPDWLFGPVWTILYIMMGFSLYLVIRKGTSDSLVAKGLCIYGAQMLVNLLWSFVFFGLHSPACGFFTIIILLMLILATILTFRMVDQNAAYLLVPYFCWVGFATILNGGIMFLN